MPAVKKGSIFLALLFSPIIGFGNALTATLVYSYITEIIPAPLIIFFGAGILGLVLAFIALRKSKIILFLFLLALAIPGYLLLFGVINIML
ncbi:MAG: hypothetical protein FWD28_04740 [Treponema sp.]|nr:hypothetical protein [Treponema sp.]